MKSEDTESWPCLSFLDDGASMTFERLCEAVNFNPTAGEDSFISQFGEGLKMFSYHVKRPGKGVRPSCCLLFADGSPSLSPASAGLRGSQV